ncbi:MAG: hypothetical protein EOP50_00880 [Sphingobacteriales bacterium]|nr:MAG: hypothetical protein EOP50_00880 [Sphingobacteriales bacterium]
MPTTTQQQTFDELYNRFGSDFENRQLWDWANYAKTYNSRNYYVWADLTPLWSTDRIPYYTSTAAAFAGGTPAGYLPAGVNSFYFAMRPIGSNDQEGYMKVITYTALSVTGALRYLADLVLPGSSYGLAQADRDRFARVKLVADVHFWDATINAYRSVKVPVTKQYFSFKLYAYEASQFEDKRTAILSLNNAVRQAAKELSLQYNRAVTIESLPRFAQLKPEYKEQVRAWKADAVAKINAMQQDPLIVAKSCTDCAKNASVGAIPVVLVVVLAAVALAGGVYVVSKLIDAANRYNAQKLAAERINAGQKNLLAMLNSSNISQADKDRYFALIQQDQQNAGDTIDDANQEPPGLFDRLQTLLLIGGGIVLGKAFLDNRGNSRK